MLFSLIVFEIITKNTLSSAVKRTRDRIGQVFWQTNSRLTELNLSINTVRKWLWKYLHCFHFSIFPNVRLPDWNVLGKTLFSYSRSMSQCFSSEFFWQISICSIIILSVCLSTIASLLIDVLFLVHYHYVLFYQTFV